MTCWWRCYMTPEEPTFAKWIFILLKVKCWDTAILLVVSDNLGQNHHLYQVSYYNSVMPDEALFDKKIGLWYCISRQRTSIFQMKNKMSTVWKKNDSLLPIWKDEREARMIPIIQIKMLSVLEYVKKPQCMNQYMYMKGDDGADQQLGCYSMLRKTLKWLKG
jgi:hypothetical protein